MTFIIIQGRILRGLISPCDCLMSIDTTHSEVTQLYIGLWMQASEVKEHSKIACVIPWFKMFTKNIPKKRLSDGYFYTMPFQPYICSILSAYI